MKGVDNDKLDSVAIDDNEEEEEDAVNKVPTVAGISRGCSAKEDERGTSDKPVDDPDENGVLNAKGAFS